MLPILGAALLKILTLDTTCEFHQDVGPERTYYLPLPLFEGYNDGYKVCRWTAKGPSKLKLSCRVTLPNIANCTGDRFVISPSGDPKFADAQVMCKGGTFNITSVGNSIIMALIKSENTVISRFRCWVYALENSFSSCNCGWSNPEPVVSKLVGGTMTAVNEYPMMAAIVNVKSKMLYCGGTIISTRHVLTAAHCRPRDTSVQDVGILVGAHNITAGADTDVSMIHPVFTFVAHPAFILETQVNDIAVVTVVDPIVFTMAVGPACLPFQYAFASFARMQVTVPGWGTLEFAGAKTDTLQKVMLDVITVPECQQRFYSVTNNQFCTYTKNKDACQFDSGGPLLWQSPDTGRLVNVGVVSYGVSCAEESPAINTRVGAYLDWIISVTSEDYFCKLE